VNRALVPWLIPVAMLVAVVVAATGAVWLLGLLLIIAGWGLLPLGIAGIRRSGTDLPRWMRFGPPR
jgi:hypothetical protein